MREIITNASGILLDYIRWQSGGSGGGGASAVGSVALELGCLTNGTGATGGYTPRL